MNLLNRAPGLPNSKLEDISARDKIEALTGVNWKHVLEHGEKIGLGSRNIKQVTIK